jgi:multidrug efflux pump subunit AcrA (membrane-fusion protein)
MADEVAAKAAGGRRGLVITVVVVALVGAGLLVWKLRGTPADASGEAPGSAAASASAASGGGAGGPVSVGIVRAERRNVDVQIDATGTVTSLTSVDVKPQVASMVTKVHIREGQFVKAGEPLFTLDARSDEANLAKAQAQLQKDQAALADAQRQLVRSKELFAQNFISQGAVDTNQAAVDAQLAAVASDRAAIEAARVSVSYSRIIAPGAGRAGQVAVVAGSRS